MRSLSAGMLSSAASIEKRILFLLEIDAASATLRYVNCVDAVSFGGNTYSSKSFVFPQSSHNTALSYEAVTVMVANLNRALGSYVFVGELRGCRLRVKQIFLDAAGDPIDTGGTGDDYIDLIDGYIEDITVSDPVVALSVRSALYALEKTVPVRNYGSTCPWVFGGTECGAATGQLTGQTADAGTTASVIADAARTEAADYWKDGLLTMTSGATSGEKRRILSSAPGTVTLEHALSAAPAAGATYTIQRGCDKQYDTCDVKFSNSANFSGFVNLPAEIIKDYGVA